MTEDEDEPTFSMADPMLIDDGELDDVTVREAFALGVEWQMVRGAIADDSPILHWTIHTGNQRRIDKLLSMHGYTRRWDLHDDWCVVHAAIDPRDLEEEELA